MLPVLIGQRRPLKSHRAVIVVWNWRGKICFVPYAQTTKPRFVLEKVRHGPGKVQEGLGTIARCVFILWRRYQIWLQVQWCSRCYSAYFATNKHFEVNALSVKLIAPSPPRMLAFLNLVSLSLSLSVCLCLSLSLSVCLLSVSVCRSVCLSECVLSIVSV